MRSLTVLPQRLAFCTLTLLFMWGCETFDQRAPQYKQTIKRAKHKLANTSKQPIHFQAKWFSHPVYPSNICAIKDTKQRAVVIVITKNNGHAGQFGYLYADKGLTLSDVSTMLDLHGCGEWTIKKEVSKGWWSIENRLG